MSSCIFIEGLIQISGVISISENMSSIVSAFEELKYSSKIIWMLQGTHYSVVCILYFAAAATASIFSFTTFNFCLPYFVELTLCLVGTSKTAKETFLESQSVFYWLDVFLVPSHVNTSSDYYSKQF